MKLIFCLDDRNGIAFNKRRQSRDKDLIKKVSEINSGKTIGISTYSEGIFEDVPFKIIENPLVEKPEIYFAEREVSNDLLLAADELQVFYWNRAYPGDTFVNIKENIWEQVKEEEFRGNSHEKITIKVYRRKNEKERS